MFDSFGCHAKSLGCTSKALILLLSDMWFFSWVKKKSLWSVLRVKGRESEMCNGRETPRSFCSRLVTSSLGVQSCERSFPCPGIGSAPLRLLEDVLRIASRVSDKTLDSSLPGCPHTYISFALLASLMFQTTQLQAILQTRYGYGIGKACGLGYLHSKYTCVGQLPCTCGVTLFRPPCSDGSS